MFKGKSKTKPVMHSITDTSFDPVVEGVHFSKEMLEEAIDEKFQDIFNSDSDNPFELDFGDDSWLNTKPADLDLPVDPFDPFSTGRGMRGDSSDLDRLKNAVDAYIKAAKNPLIMHSSIHLSEVEALRHIIVYWLDRNRDRLIRDFRRLA